MGVVIVEGEGAHFGVNLGRSIVTHGAFATRSSQVTLTTFIIVIMRCGCIISVAE